MASPLDLLQQGINTCNVPAPAAAQLPTQNVIVQSNQLGCNSACSIPPTPPSVALQPNIGQDCGDFQACIQNIGTVPLTVVIGGKASPRWGFADHFDPSLTFTALQAVTLGNTPVNASALAISCNQGIASGQGTFASYIEFMNSEFALIPAIAQGLLVARVRQINTEGPDNRQAQLSNGFTAWEVDSFDGAKLDVCTREMDVNFCSPCNSSNDNTPVSFQENCVTYIGPDNGLAYQIEPNTQVTIQFCYAGIADINNYRTCSVPSWSNGNAAY